MSILINALNSIPSVAVAPFTQAGLDVFSSAHFVSEGLSSFASQGLDIARNLSLPKASLFAPTALVSIGSIFTQEGSLLWELEREARFKATLGLDHVLEAVCKPPPSKISSLPFANVMQCLLRGIRVTGCAATWNLKGFDEEAALLFLDAVRDAAFLQNDIPFSKREIQSLFAEQILTHEFSDKIFASVAYFWDAARKGIHFDKNYKRQKIAFACALARAFTEMHGRRRGIRSGEFVSAEIRDPMNPEHLRAPKPLTPETITNPCARRYFFSGEQVQIPGVRSAFDATISLFVGTVSEEGFFIGGLGTAFLISGEGHVVTCAHVLKHLPKQGGQVGSMYQDRDVIFEGAKILEIQSFLQDSDLALMRVPQLAGLPFVPLLDKPPESGKIGFAIGHPGIFATRSSPEKMISFGEIRTSKNEFELRADIEGRTGSSGGPVVDDQGQLLGVLFEGPREQFAGGSTGLVSVYAVRRMLERHGVF
ncbi:MAG: serine protease [Deltaproteobacteria bacterium]|nr:serine protease [Deltaproteobacteria bacterium]